MRNLKTVLILAAAMTAACLGFGKITVTGTVGGRTIKPQTIFAYLVDKTYEAGSDGKLHLVPIPAEKQVMVIQLDGADYDPTGDLRFLSADEKLRISQEQTLNGSVKIIIEGAGKLGSTYDSSSDNGRSAASCSPDVDGASADSPLFQDFCYRFAAAEIQNEEAPKTLKTIGSARKFSVKLDKVGKKPGEVTSGKVTLEFKKKSGTDADPDDALEGTIELKLEAEHIGQRVALCNPDPRFLHSDVEPGQSSSSSGLGDSYYNEECDQFEGG